MNFIKFKFETIIFFSHFLALFNGIKLAIIIEKIPNKLTKPMKIITFYVFILSGGIKTCLVENEWNKICKSSIFLSTNRVIRTESFPLYGGSDDDGLLDAYAIVGSSEYDSQWWTQGYPTRQSLQGKVEVRHITINNINPLNPSKKLLSFKLTSKRDYCQPGFLDAEGLNSINVFRTPFSTKLEGDNSYLTIGAFGGVGMDETKLVYGMTSNMNDEIWRWFGANRFICKLIQNPDGSVDLKTASNSYNYFPIWYFQPVLSQRQFDH
jgi:hypothetical protein